MDHTRQIDASIDNVMSNVTTNDPEEKRNKMTSRVNFTYGKTIEPTSKSQLVAYV